MSGARDAIKQFDGAEDLAQAQREALEALFSLASAKGALFEAQLAEDLRTAGKGDDKTVPIANILDRRTFIRAYSSTEVENIAGQVGENLKNIVAGGVEGIVDGVAGIISTAIKAFLGEASGSEGSESHYYVISEPRYLRLTRIDMMMWYRNVVASSITKRVEMVSICTYAKSTVDYGGLPYSTFRDLYIEMLSKADLTKEQIDAELALVKQLYDDYAKVNPTAASDDSVLALSSFGRLRSA